jgi:hypothetical protein
MFMAVTSDGFRAWRMRLADVAEREDVAPDSGRIAGRGVDQELRGPQVETGQAHLGRGPVAKLQVQGRLGDVDRGLASPGGVARANGSIERVENTGHLRPDQPRDLPHPVGVPCGAHPGDRGGSGCRVPVLGPGGIDHGGRAPLQGPELGGQRDGRRVRRHRKRELSTSPPPAVKNSP